MGDAPGEQDLSHVPVVCPVCHQVHERCEFQAGHGEIVAWSYELAVWFALTEGRYHDVVTYAQAGQQHAGLTSAMVQLVLEQARGQARLGERRDVHAGLDQGAKLLETLPKPEHPENHFVFAHTKWIFYAADCNRGLRAPLRPW